MDDSELLEEYAARGSEDAFSTLVSRHIPLVYSAALRQVGNREEAEEITQAVFMLLARKAGALRHHPTVSGWLYQATRRTAASANRRQWRRLHREQEAYMQATLNEPEPDPWEQVRPLLDEAMAKLSEGDRNAIVLRYFESKPLKEVGAALGSSDEAAKMRVLRAVEKLRGYFQQRGVTISAAALGAALTAHSIEAAPAGLSIAVATACRSSALTASTMSMAQGAANMMAWTKVAAALGVTAATVIALQWNQIAAQKEQTARLQEQFEQALQMRQIQAVAPGAVAGVKDENGLQEINLLKREKARLAASNASLRATMAGAPRSGGDSSTLAGIAKIFGDPDISKALMENDAQELRKKYGPLVKELNLTPEQRDAFYGLLVSEETNTVSSGLKLLEDLAGTNTAGVANSAAVLKSAAQDYESQLQTLLGASGYAQYQDFKASLPDRQMVAQMQQGLTDDPMTEAQQEQLLRLMITARKDNPPGSSAAPRILQGMTGNLDQSLQTQVQINQQIYQGATGFLSAGQLQALGNAQSNLLNDAQLGIAFGQKILAPYSNTLSGLEVKFNIGGAAGGQ